MITVELFAGAGGMALGFEKAGFEHLLLNEIDNDASNTLKTNRPNWFVLTQDIQLIDWHTLNLPKVDIVTGGFPCQPFSYSGKLLGLEDTRGTLFYEFARAINAIQPTCFLAENVRGLLTHDKGQTLKTILQSFNEVGYHVFTPTLLNANLYQVAQKRERLFIFGVKKELAHLFSNIQPKQHTPLTLHDIFISNTIYSNDIESLDQSGYLYSEKKKQLFSLVPQGGNWRDIPKAKQQEYMGKMYYSQGGKTGVLKRLSYHQPAPTILTSPSQKQTERCHPIYDRPLTIRESARIQSFPDDWKFCGSISSQYRQIGNAVPVNMAFFIALDIKQKLLTAYNEM